MLCLTEQTSMLWHLFVIYLKGTVSIQCPDEIGWRYWSRYCYFISSARAKPWKDANSTCSRYRGAELVWFESEEELVQLLISHFSSPNGFFA